MEMKFKLTNDNFQDEHVNQNVMPADWVRNKHLGKKGEFRYF
jgi:hypothetical protein